MQRAESGRREGVQVQDGGRLGACAADGLRCVGKRSEETVVGGGRVFGDAGGAGVRRGFRYAVRIRDKRPSCGAAQRWL